MLNLNDREWIAFFLSDIFSIKAGKRLTKSDMDIGNIPFIGATDSNNGITNWIATANSSLDKNVLGVNYNGSVVENFYHGYNCIFSDDVKRLHLKNAADNKYVLLFFKTIILKQKVKYTYGYKFNGNRMERQKILVPVDKQGNPDYAFMEQYIRERESQLIQKYKDFIGRISQSGGALSDLKSVKWKAFRILDLFDYQRGNQNNMNSLSYGNEMLISAKNINNGLKGFFSSNGTQKSLYQGNCITLNNDGDGGVGLAYYQPCSFLLDTHVYALYPKADIGKYAMLYISRTISKQRECFSHGYSINQERLKKLKIMLPVDEKEKPDYNYMEQCGKQLILQKYRQYLDYISA